MGNYFVGQRVKVDFPKSYFHGQEATILALDVCGTSGLYGSFVGHQLDLRGPEDWRYRDCVIHPKHLIPITRPDSETETDRNKVVPWDDCDWKPAHLRESVK